LIEAAGFQAAAVRAIVAGLDLMARSKAPKQVFAELRPCVAWCCARRSDTKAATSVDEIALALEPLRATT
jgi:hypothetical protein